MGTVNILASHYTFLHREITVHPYNSFILLFSFYSKGGSFIVPTSSDTVHQAWKQMLLFTNTKIFSWGKKKKKDYQQAQLLYKN